MNNINNYNLMVPPFEFVPFEEMNKRQAKEYCDWYVSQTESRIAELKKYSISHGMGSQSFDNSIDSFSLIWEWFESQIALVPKSQEEMQRELSGRPKWMQDIIEQNTDRLSNLTIAMAIDISFYFAKVFMMNNPTIFWDVRTRPKMLASVNRPVLSGFINDMILDPSKAVIINAQRSSRLPSPIRLLELYQTWLAFIKK